MDARDEGIAASRIQVMQYTNWEFDGSGNQDKYKDI